MLLGLLLAVDVVWAPPWLVASSTMGWVVPLASVIVIAAVSWALLAQTGRDEGDDGSLYVTCPTCGRPVFREWRLCPYCGVRLEAEKPTGSAFEH